MLNEIEDEWLKFLEDSNKPFTRNIDVADINNNLTLNTINNNDIEKNNDDVIPKCSDIYISTKTKISYFNMKIDLGYLFWLIPIIEYHEQQEGIIKKQMKFQSTNEEELNSIVKRCHNYYYYKFDILCSIDNPNGKIKFKDTRKINIGLSKKDIVNTRCKTKSAFYNCFVIVFRININNIFKEIHIKIFNTGKLEIPGIKDDSILDIVLNKLIDILKNIKGYENIKYLKEKTENVLINSNFNCGYYIDREKLYYILRNKYNINSCYDPCSYPGIQSEFYYNNINKEHIQKGSQPTTNKEYYTKISFMIFRTGSVLMVGKCSEFILYDIYKYISNILYNEYNVIATRDISISDVKTIKNKKYKKKIIYIES